MRWVDGYRQVDELTEQLPNTRLTDVADREADIDDLLVEAPGAETAADWLVCGQHDSVLTTGQTLRQHGAAAPLLAATTFERLPATASRPAPSIKNGGPCGSRFRHRGAPTAHCPRWKSPRSWPASPSH